MPTPIRMQVTWQVGSMLPRDRFTITPHFEHTQVDIGDTDWQQLVDDLATALKAWEMAPTAHELTVKAYNLNDPEVRRPKATKVLTTGQAAEAGFFREVALCLSFSGGTNQPHQRGRLYIPHVKCSNDAPGPRPSTTHMNKVGALVPILTGLGGLNVDWVVRSATRETSVPVNKWFVDDEWDVQRRRGLRPITRVAGTATE